MIKIREDSMNAGRAGSVPSNKVYPEQQVRKKQASDRDEKSYHCSRDVRKEKPTSPLLQRSGGQTPYKSKPRTSPHRSFAKTDRKHSEKAASSQKMRRLGHETEIEWKIRKYHDKCYEHMRSFSFEDAQKTINEMERELKLDWCNVKDLTRRHRITTLYNEKIYKINDIRKLLSVIAKFPPKLVEDGNESSGENKVHRVQWQRDLPEDYSSLDLELLCNSISFVQHYLLNKDLHNDQSDAAVIDRLKAARNHLIWIQNSRSLKLSFHYTWLECYSKTCSQLIEKDPGFAESAEGQQAKKIVELSNAVSRTRSPGEALDILKKQHVEFLREGVTRETALVMGCGVSALSDRWKNDSRYKVGKHSIALQKNSFFYGYGLLIFGFKWHRETLQKGNQEAISKMTGNIHSLGKLSIPALPRHQAMRDFAEEVISELSSPIITPKTKSVASEYLAKCCSILLQDGWRDAMTAIDEGEFKAARKNLKGLGKLSQYEQPVADVLMGWCYFKEGRPKKATQWLKSCSKAGIDCSSYFEAIRLHLDLGDEAQATSMIDDASEHLHDIRRLAFEELKKQEKQLIRKRQRAADNKSEQIKAKRKRTQAPEKDTPVKKATVMKSIASQIGAVKEFKTAECQTEPWDYEKLENSLNKFIKETKIFKTKSREYQENLKSEIKQLKAKASQSSGELKKKVEELEVQIKIEKELSAANAISHINAAENLNKEISELKIKLKEASDEQEAQSIRENKQKQELESYKKIKTDLKISEGKCSRMESVVNYYKTEQASMELSIKNLNEKVVLLSQEVDKQKNITEQKVKRELDFEQKLEESEKCQDDLKAEIHRISQDNLRISQEQKDSEKYQDDLKAEINRISQDNLRISEELKESKKRNADLDAGLQKVKQNNLRIFRELVDSEKRNADLNVELQDKLSISQKLAESEKRNADLNVELQDKLSISQKLAESEKRNADLNVELQDKLSISQKLVESEKRNADLNVELQDKLSISQKLAESEKRNADLNVELQDKLSISQKLAESEKRNADLNVELQYKLSISQKLAESEKYNADLNIDLQLANQDKLYVSQKMAEIEKRNAGLNADLQRVNKELQRVNKEKKESEKSNDYLNTELQRVIRNNTRLFEKLTQTEFTLKAFEEGNYFGGSRLGMSTPSTSTSTSSSSNQHAVTQVLQSPSDDPAHDEMAEAMYGMFPESEK